MKIRKWMKALMLGSMLSMPFWTVPCAGEEPAGGVGSDSIAEEIAAPQAGAGIGLSVPPVGEKQGIIGSVALGVGADLGKLFGDKNSDLDTVILEDIELTLQIRGSYMLVNAEDEYFYYIYTRDQQGIPDIIVGAFNWDTTDGFFDAYTYYFRQNRTDLTILQEPEDVVIGNKSLQKFVYNYYIQGYKIQDTRYIWLAPNKSVYMFAKREIPDISYTLGTTLEDIIPTAAVIGMDTTSPLPENVDPQPETTVPQPETAVPQPETAVPQSETTVPQPETTVPQDLQGSLYVKNADSSWTVTTDYYTMIIPPAWTGHFDAFIPESYTYSSGYSLQVVNKESADANFGGRLFTIMLIPEGESYSEFPRYDYLGTMAGPDGIFSVVILYPTDAQTGDMWQVFYKILDGDKNTALTSIRPVSGVTWTLPDGSVISGSNEDNTEIQDPLPEPTGSTDVLGTTSGTSYTNGLFGMNFHAPAGWILASQEQLEELNQGLSADLFLANIEAGTPVCIAYAQSMDGMDVMNVFAQNVAPYLDASVTELTQEDAKFILEQGMASASSSMESLGAVVTGAGINSVTCMGKTFYSLDITFTYAGFSGTQKQIYVTAGTRLAMVTVRSISGDNTQAMLDMF